ncbi:carbamoyl phosphate synthase small subunit, partial [Xanthomonas citri pv. citri]|nr:carbamoyl phosphate synthase small subunit [Xanthomonas citri pv. citri]
ARLAESVTTEQPYVIEPAEHGWEGEPIAEIAALDLGIKAATPRHLASRGIRVHVLPAATDLAGIRAVDPDGVFLSNGPGDPATADAQ